ncbi:MAG: hypothetical protein B6229_06535 [Spirochaetaceae bacterium 4572_7]|nr:MAG: hypothetical protein B6229_06535 [Spirochaetaceae bacterium 4572_7]
MLFVNLLLEIYSIINKYQEDGVLKAGYPMDIVVSLIAPFAIRAMNPLGMEIDPPNLRNYVDSFLTGHKTNKGSSND